MNKLQKIKQLETVHYTTNCLDIAYLLGVNLSRGALMIGQGKAVLFVDGRYQEACKSLTEIELRMWSLKDKLNWLKEHDIKRLSYDPKLMSLLEFRELQDYLQVEDDVIAQERAIKTAAELTKIRNSAEVNWKAFTELLNSLRVGISEKEAAWIFEKKARELGAEKMSFGPTIAFGKSSFMAHYRTSDVLLEENMPVLIDVGVVKEGYHSDMTRSFLFEGENEEYEKMRELVIQTQKRAAEMIKPGVRVADVDRFIREEFEKEHVLNAYHHAAGHGIGLETHEFPRISYQTDQYIEFKEGMVITIEPGLYFSDKWGIRHEDTFIIHRTGVENLYENESWYRAG